MATLPEAQESVKEMVLDEMQLAERKLGAKGNKAAANLSVAGNKAAAGSSMVPRDNLHARGANIVRRSHSCPPCFPPQKMFKVRNFRPLSGPRVWWAGGGFGLELL